MEILDDPLANFNMPLYISAALNKKQKIFKAGLFLSVKFSLKDDAAAVETLNQSGNSDLNLKHQYYHWPAINGAQASKLPKGRVHKKM